jgi:methionyl-tRNA formyltransferase
MQMERGLDTGPVYSVYERELNGNERADRLEHELGELAAGHIAEDLLKIKEGILKPVVQDNLMATYAAKIVKTDGLVNWEGPASAIDAKKRAYCHWPGAFFHLGFKCGNSLEIKITECRIMTGPKGKPGEIIKADKNAWVIACGDGAVELSRVVPQGKKEMSGPEFLRGLHNGADGMKVICGN